MVTKHRPSRTEANRKNDQPQWIRFGRDFGELLRKKGFSFTSFGKAVGVGARMPSSVADGVCAISESALTGVQFGKGGVPKSKVKWADALGLKGKAREEFETAAWLSRAPFQAWQIAQDLKEKVKELTAINIYLKRCLAEAKAGHGTKLPASKARTSSPGVKAKPATAPTTTPRPRWVAKPTKR